MKKVNEVNKIIDSLSKLIDDDGTVLDNSIAIAISYLVDGVKGEDCK